MAESKSNKILKSINDYSEYHAEFSLIGINRLASRSECLGQTFCIGGTSSFITTNVDGFFLEYDTDRSGSFAPLRYLPKDKSAILGIISTKLHEIEPADQVKRRVDEASRYVDLDRLGLSPQCGFASGYHIDRFSLDEQERKLANLVKIADEIWK